MLVLFDNGTPRTLARYLIDRHTVTEARARGWDQLSNGELLNEAEAAGFEVLVTTDRNLSYQQNLTGRKIAIVVLGKGRWSLINQHVAEVAEAVSAATPGSFVEVEIPDEYSASNSHISRSRASPIPALLVVTVPLRIITR